METPLKNRAVIWLSIASSIALSTAACTTKTSAQGPQPPPEVQVSTVVQSDVPVYHEWIGTLDGMVNACSVKVMMKSPVTSTIAMEAMNSGVVSLGFSGFCGFAAAAFAGAAFTSFLVAAKCVFPRDRASSALQARVA